jgi:hypothetical protein
MQGIDLSIGHADFWDQDVYQVDRAGALQRGLADQLIEGRMQRFLSG